MQKTILKSIAAISLAILFFSCKKESVAPAFTKTIQLPTNGDAVVNASNGFAFNFFKKTLEQDTATANQLVSPLSIYLALSMVYNGAANTTKDAIEKVLQLQGISIQDLNNTCQALMQQLPEEDSRVKLSIANSLWYKKQAQPLTPFINTAQQNYLAGTQALDFADPASVDIINNWISEHTGNKINKILQSIAPEDLMYLINAIYFKGGWQHVFDASKTSNGYFYLKDGNTVNVPFMNQELTTNYYADNTMRLMELSYGGGKSYSMYIAMPANQGQSLNDFAASIDKTSLANAINQMDSTQIDLALPAWEYAYNVTAMQNILTDLGMEIAFTESADFTNIYPGNAHITKAMHKAYIKVNEEGTEAAAVTVIGIGDTAFTPGVKVTVDHPFVYLIVEKQTGTVLFMGKVGNPAVH